MVGVACVRGGAGPWYRWDLYVEIRALGGLGHLGPCRCAPHIPGPGAGPRRDPRMNGDIRRQRTTRRVPVLVALALSTAGLSVLSPHRATALPTDTLSFVTDVSVIEDSATVMNFTVTLPADATNPVTGTYKTQVNGTDNASSGHGCTTTAMSDFDDVATPDQDGTTDTPTLEADPEGGTFTIAPGGDSATLSVKLCGDSSPEPNETFTVLVENLVGATCDGGDCTAVGTILNDDGLPPAVSIDDATFSEGVGTASFNVNLTSAPVTGSSVAVSYATTNGSATSGADFTAKAAATSTLTFNAGV